MKKNTSIMKPIGLMMLVVLFASFMAAINVSVVKAPPDLHLLINEFISTGIEKVELYNPTASDVNLSTWILSDRPLFSPDWPGGEDNETLPNVNITAGLYYVIDVSTLSAEMALSDEADDLHLYDNSTGTPVLVDEVAWGKLGGAPDPPRDNSTARAPNGQDTGNDAADWTIDTTPTLGSANDAPPADLCKGPIKINEILAKPENESEFIELYNDGTKGTVDIGGWWISDGEDIYVIPSGTSILANNWWYRDERMNNVGFEDYADNVYLFNSTGHRIDQMGWSSEQHDGTSVARYSDGVGQCYAYNDTTLVECGWAQGRTKNGSPGSSNLCTRIWVTFKAEPFMVRMSQSNYTLINATIANMKTTSTTNVNATLTLPEPHVTLTPNPIPPYATEKKVVLGDLAAYEKRVVVWNVTANVTGYHLVNLTVTAQIEPNPRNITTGILSLPKVDIIFDDSHDIYYDWDRMYTFRGFLQEKGYLYRLERGFRITDEILEGVKLLVLPAIQSDYIANETEVIKNFIDNGGSVLILGYAHWPGGFMTWDIQNNITSAYGINFTATHIYDNNDNTGNPIWSVVKTWANNPIANNLTYNVQKVSSGRACMLNITESGPVPIGTGDTDPGTDKTYAENATEHVVAEGTDVIVHAAVETPGGGRIFATGSATIFCDASYYMQYEDGEQFAKNVIRWLWHREFDVATSIVSIAKNTTGEYVAPAKTVMGQQSKGAYFNVAVENQGLNTETGINVALYYRNATGDYLIGTQTGITLNPYQIYNITFTWNTLNVKRDRITGYTIFANVTVVSGEIDTADNTYIFGTVKVVIPGNVNADTQVNVLDLGKLGVHWLAKVGETLYNPNVDINNDAVINVIDLGTVGVQWLKYE